MKILKACMYAHKNVLVSMLVNTCEVVMEKCPLHEGLFASTLKSGTFVVCVWVQPR